VASKLASLLAATGTQVGVVTTTDATTSAVLYPDGQRKQARVLAAGLGLATPEGADPVDHVTVVIGAQDFARLVATPSIC
jgi:hypothetical protein